MHQLTGVLLNVDSGNADAFFAAFGLNVQMALAAQREIILGNLIGLRQVGVEIVLPILLGIGGDFAAGGKSGLYRILHHLAIEYRQRTGHTRAHRAALGVGCSTELGGAAAENLCGSFQLYMDLQSNDHLIICNHASLPPSCSKAKPARYSVGSEKGFPISCIPMGSPPRSLPQGRDSAGSPAIFTGTV